MNSNPGQLPSDESSRLVELEELFTHLEQKVQILDQVTCEQQKALQQAEHRTEQLRQKLQSLEAVFDELQSGDRQEPPPPHY